MGFTPAGRWEVYVAMRHGEVFVFMAGKEKKLLSEVDVDC